MGVAELLSKLFIFTLVKESSLLNGNVNVVGLIIKHFCLLNVPSEKNINIHDLFLTFFHNFFLALLKWVR